MADSKRVELILGIRTTGAADASAGLESITKTAAELSGNLSKLERGDVLKEIGATAAQAAINIGSVDTVAEHLAAQLKAVGASEAEIRKVSTAFDQTLVSIQKAERAQIDAARAAEKAQDAQVAKFLQAQSKQIEQVEKFKQAQLAAAAVQEKAARQADKAQEEFIINQRIAATSATTLQKSLAQISRAEQIQRLGAEFGNLAKKTKDMGGAVAQLNKQLQELGASKDEIRSAADAFSGAGQQGGGNRLARFGSELRALPSTQIPGLGIGTDQVASIIRLGGALGTVSEKVSLVTTVATALTPLLGATAAGLAGVATAAGIVAAPLLAIALAVKALGDQAAAEAKSINATIDAQRSVSQEIAQGLTSDQAAEKLATLNAQRKAEADLLFKNQQIYDENINSAGALTGVLKVASGAEDALAGQITTSTDTIKGYDTQIQSLTQATESGTLAANDAKVAEQELAAERSKTALASADSAGKELQSQQRALNATEEQNKKRLDTIDDERAVVERQIETLEASGVVSEEVTAKIAGLKDQLGLLGKESGFITDTALEASRAADAEKKAVKDAEDAAKKAAQAQEQYTKAVSSASTAYKTSLEDIGTRFRQTLSDNQLKFNRDLTDLTTKYRRDEIDLEEKARRSERDAAQDQVNDLKNIQKDAYKEEQDALREGDFKALFLAREKGAEELQQQQEEIDTSRQKREQANRDAQTDLVKNAQRQRQDRMLNNERQIMDARTANERELSQARLTQQRALQMASAALNAELGIRQAFWNATVKQAQNALTQISGGASGPNTLQRPGGFTPGSFTANAIGSIIRK